MKINQLEIENVKRVKAVSITPSASGLTIIGGKNGQGKTSVLDAITWALGGDKYKPTDATRNGSELPPNIRIELSNGLIVERTGKNSDLKVTDSKGMRGGQQLLNSFVEQFALDLPKFMESNNKDKASTLLKIIGVDAELSSIEAKEAEAFSLRRAAGLVADQKEKYANELPAYADAPSQIVSANDLVKRHQEAIAKNSANDRVRDALAAAQRQFEAKKHDMEEAKAAFAVAEEQYKSAKASEKALVDVETDSIEKQISGMDENNRKAQANIEKKKANEEAHDARVKHTKLDLELSALRAEKAALLSNAVLPLPDLTVQDGELMYKGHKWDCVSGSDQLRIATAIVRKLNPQCEFILLDKLEQMDIDTLQEFGVWLEAEGLQVIATRVSVGEECSIIVVDGCATQEVTQ
jgi:predicted ATP-binding protein involved in virulence